MRVAKRFFWYFWVWEMKTKVRVIVPCPSVLPYFQGRKATTLKTLNARRWIRTQPHDAANQNENHFSLPSMPTNWSEAKWRSREFFVCLYFDCSLLFGVLVIEMKNEFRMAVSSCVCTGRVSPTRRKWHDGNSCQHMSKFRCSPKCTRWFVKLPFRPCPCN